MMILSKIVSDWEVKRKDELIKIIKKWLIVSIPIVIILALVWSYSKNKV